jgi:hypothetical protein
MPDISALQRQKASKFEVSLGCIRIPCLKKQNKVKVKLISKLCLVSYINISNGREGSANSA